MALDKKTERGTGGLPSWPKLYGSNSNTSNCCGAEHQVAVLLVCQLYRFSKRVSIVSAKRLFRHYGMPAKVVIIIRDLYEGFSTQVVHNGQRTQPQNMRTGIRQSCLLSPLLFLVALDWVTRTAFDRKRGIQWTFTTSLEDLDFADDLALLSHRIQDMKVKKRALEVQGAKAGLKINATKTNAYCVGCRGAD